MKADYLAHFPHPAPLMLSLSKHAPAWTKGRATHRFLASAAVLAGACFDKLSMKVVGGGAMPSLASASRAAFASLLLASPASAQDQPANTLQELFAEINACIGPLPLHSGTAMSIRFALRRDGSLIGQPRVTYMQTPNNQADRDEDLKTVANAFNHCVPVKITPALGGAIAGQLFTFSYLPKKPEQKA